MARIKKQRVGIKLDMTPMVDVAFLLLTFFMLTTTFRPPEEIDVVVPDSHSDLRLPSGNVLTISVDREGHIWMNVDAQVIRSRLFGPDYATRAGKEVALDDLDELVNRAMVENLGLRGSKGEMQVIVRADRDAEYAVVSGIIGILQKQRIGTVRFVTNLEK